MFEPITIIFKYFIQCVTEFLFDQSILHLTSQMTRIKTIIHFDIQEYILDGVIMIKRHLLKGCGILI